MPKNKLINNNMKLNLFKTIYKRDTGGQYVCGLSVLKLATMTGITLMVTIGTAYSMIVAPTLNKTNEDNLTVATQEIIWTATGTQERVEGNVIWSLSNGESIEPAVYVGNNIQDLYKFKEWEMQETREAVEEWKKKAGEPTAILTYVCRQNGINSKDCPVTLYAMAQHESYFGKAMVGDGGHSHGYFHIMDYHKVPASCSENLECSADWTLKRMIRLGYKTNPGVAVMKHNGTPNTKATLAYLDSVNRKKALWPN